MAIFSGKNDANTDYSFDESLEAVLSATRQLAEGNWDTAVDGQHTDAEIPARVQKVLEYLEKIRQLHLADIERVTQAGGSVRRTSIELGQTSNDLYQEIATFSAALKTLSEGAIAQAEMANELDQGMATISSEAAEHQQLAEDAESTSESIRESVSAGEANIVEILQGWETTITQLRSAGSEIETFEQTTREISSIVEVISEIAHRTNVLSLNASLEADRSGEEAEAFSVLATEIRGLSDNAKRQAAGIDTLLNDFMGRQSDLLHRLREGITDLDQGAKGVDTVRTNLSSTVEGIESVALRIVRLARGFAQLAERISTLRDQAKNVAKISEQHADVTQETVAQTRDRMLVGADQLLHESRNLDRVSNELDTSVKSTPENS